MCLGRRVMLPTFPPLPTPKNEILTAWVKMYLHTVGSLHHSVAVLDPDEKLLVLIFDAHFFPKTKRAISHPGPVLPPSRRWQKTNLSLSGRSRWWPRRSGRRRQRRWWGRESGSCRGPGASAGRSISLEWPSPSEDNWRKIGIKIAPQPDLYLTRPNFCGDCGIIDWLACLNAF